MITKNLVFIDIRTFLKYDFFRDLDATSLTMLENIREKSFKKIEDVYGLNIHKVDTWPLSFLLFFPLVFYAQVLFLLVARI